MPVRDSRTATKGAGARRPRSGLLAGLDRLKPVRPVLLAGIAAAVFAGLLHFRHQKFE